MIPANEGLASQMFIFFLKWTALISIFWGIFNLLPIYPMDGGHISREIFLFFFPRRGVEISLIVSILTAALLAVMALQSERIFIAFLFAYFAYQNYQEMTFGSFRRWNTSVKMDDRDVINVTIGGLLKHNRDIPITFSRMSLQTFERQHLKIVSIFIFRKK